MKLSQETADVIRRAVREAFNAGLARTHATRAERERALNESMAFAVSLATSHVEAEIDRRAERAPAATLEDLTR